MPLIIRNISAGPSPIQNYSVAINDRPPVATFSFDRFRPMGDCLRAAAAAVDAAQGRTTESDDFWRGVAWAINQLTEEAYQLEDVRDGYIEAKSTGVHNGRKIPPEFAKACASKFGERSDAVFVIAEFIQRALDTKSKTVK